MSVFKFRKSFFFAVVVTVVFNGIAQETLQTVVAEKGDGILSLLRKQGVNPYEGYDEFISLNIDNLRDSTHLYEGRVYKIPTVLNTKVETKTKDVTGISYAIFGDKYAEVISQSTRLEGAVYYLVSGHGGPDPGAMTTYRGKAIAEDEYAYDVTLRLAKELLSHGAMVYIIVRDPDDGIRDDRILEIDRDEVVYPDKIIPLNQVARLKQRVEVVNELYRKNKGKYQRLIVTHVDSRSKGQNIDVFFYHHEKSTNGKKLAESIHKTFQAKYKKYQPNRTYEGTFEDRSSLYLVKKTHPAMTFIEIGNITNKKDQRRILDYENRQALAKWISEGVLLDYEKK
ncbi:N-acetylmuramoyl-L-alanine amidase [Cellulophaga baltica]|uniref:N-acetylmuramoyl-L-alanine amidase family protein n=1 Tax=Cellulophaga TaxID=104264 RepID=UPI001C06E523|nr:MULTISPECIES: N-acetylmuramoyl-L-alanine amidase [Cellulophaga]MBU2995482.1 N-acetylmuramoyl-L-alanine amidase [Cellulophaga baltica]MDO6766876.1 N-acetylmuramoyl-L-alanine amidase [Cellulophaga sp. 1_MG-2023]